MNRYFTNPIYNLHNYVLPYFRPYNYVNDPFLRKKLSDFYFSKLIPDFYGETSLKWNYSPYVISSRVTFSVFLTLVYYFCFFKCRNKGELEKNKKYRFDFYIKPFLEYEKAHLIKEKKNGIKLFL